MPFMNFKIVNTKKKRKNLKKLLKYGISIHQGFNHSAVTQRYRIAFVEKTSITKCIRSLVKVFFFH